MLVVFHVGVWFVCNAGVSHGVWHGQPFGCAPLVYTLAININNTIHGVVFETNKQTSSIYVCLHMYVYMCTWEAISPCPMQPKREWYACIGACRACMKRKRSVPGAVDAWSRERHASTRQATGTQTKGKRMRYIIRISGPRTGPRTKKNESCRW